MLDASTPGLTNDRYAHLSMNVEEVKQKKKNFFFVFWSSGTFLEKIDSPLQLSSSPFPSLPGENDAIALTLITYKY